MKLLDNLQSKKLTFFAFLLARFALASSFLSAVADRFGLWGKAGTAGVVWGNFDSFLKYTATLNPWAPTFLSNSLGYLATLLEVVFGVLLLVGFKVRLVSFFSFLLLSVFALSMTFTVGIKSVFDYSVFTAASAALLLFLADQESSST